MTVHKRFILTSICFIYSNSTSSALKIVYIDFQVRELSKSSLNINARNVEVAIQRSLQPLELVLRRLHRYIGKGQRYQNNQGVARCHKVFITTSANFNSPQL